MDGVLGRRSRERDAALLFVGREKAPVSGSLCATRKASIGEAAGQYPGDCHLNYAQIHFASVAAFVAGWRSS